jgi:hypothetical protein
MTPEICLISVPHTGTMFVREIFVQNGWHEQGLNGRPNPTPTMFVGHCEKPTQVGMAQELGRRMPIVMPMRHPYRVEESWRRRGHTEIVRLYRCYYQMLLILAERTQLWIPVDGRPLCKHIAHKQLNDVAGKEMKVDWDTLVNAEKNTHDIDLSELTPSKDMREIRGYPLFTTWYGERETEDEVLAIARSAAATHSDAGEGHHDHAER